MGKGIHKYLKTPKDLTLADVYEKYHVGLIRLAKYYLHSVQKAEDAVSDVFYKIMETEVEFSKIENIKNYLYTSVKRKCLDELNKSSAKNQGLDNIEHQNISVNFKDPETTYLNRELGSKIKLCIENLPDRCRTVFLMVKEDNLKYKEVADILNISQKTVELHMGNALKALRKSLEDYAIPKKSKKTISIKQLILFVIGMI